MSKSKPAILVDKPVVAVPSRPIAEKCIKAIQDMDTLLLTNPDIPTLSGRRLIDFDREMAQHNRILRSNLKKLGPISPFDEFPQLNVPTGIAVIKDPEMRTALTDKFGDETCIGWNHIRALSPTKYDWLTAILDDPTMKHEYTTMLTETLEWIIAEEDLIMPIQILQGQGTISRIAESRRLEIDPFTREPYPALRWNPWPEDVATWVNTSSGDSCLYAKSNGTSVALHRTMLNTILQVNDEHVAPGIVKPVIKRELLLLLNLDSIDYNDLDIDDQLTNTDLIQLLIQLVKYRIIKWNMSITHDTLLDNSCEKRYDHVHPNTRLAFTVKRGKMGAEEPTEVHTNDLYEPYHSHSSYLVSEGERKSYYCQDKVLHYPLVDILNIFSDMLNYCITDSTRAGGETFTLVDAMIPDDAEMRSIFPPSSPTAPAKEGFQIRIGGTVASPIKTTNSSGRSGLFCGEIVLNTEIYNSHILQEMTGTMTPDTNKKGFKFSHSRGGARNTGSVDYNAKFIRLYQEYRKIQLSRYKDIVLLTFHNILANRRVLLSKFKSYGSVSHSMHILGKGRRRKSKSRKQNKSRKHNNKSRKT